MCLKTMYCILYFYTKSVKAHSIHNNTVITGGMHATCKIWKLASCHVYVATNLLFPCSPFLHAPPIQVPPLPLTIPPKIIQITSLLLTALCLLCSVPSGR